MAAAKASFAEDVLDEMRRERLAEEPPEQPMAEVEASGLIGQRQASCIHCQVSIREHIHTGHHELVKATIGDNHDDCLSDDLENWQRQEEKLERGTVPEALWDEAIRVAQESCAELEGCLLTSGRRLRLTSSFTGLLGTHSLCIAM